MEYSKLIHELTDGTLDPQCEDELFMALSSNEEYRTELKQQLAIKNAIRRDSKAFIPSAQSTMKLFTALGFTATASAVGAAASTVETGLWTKVGLLMTKYSAAIITGLSTAVLSTVVSYMAFSPNPAKPIVPAGNGVANIAQQIQPAQPVPIVSAAPEEQKKNTIIKYVYIERPQAEEKSNIEPVETKEFAVNPTISASSAEPAMSSKFSPGTENSIPEQMEVANRADLSGLMGLEPLPINLNLEIRFAQSFFVNRENISPSINSRFNNNCLSLQYSLGSEISTGLELRQETFYQKYTGKDDKGYLFSYEQQPNFTSVSAFVRYAPEAMQYKAFKPFTQLTLGGNKAGPLARGMLGVLYNPYPSIGFLLSGECSNLFFKHQDATFNSTKFAVHYGILLMF